MRFALRSRRGPHVSVGQVRFLLATFYFYLTHSCPLVFTPALTKEKSPYIMLIAHMTPLYAGQYEAVETGD